MTSFSAEGQSSRAAWEREYEEVRAYTTSYRDELDRGVEFLLGYLAGAGISLEGPLLECACGRGRNALPLAARGHAVVGLDHAHAALRRFRERAEREGHSGQAVPVRHDLREAFPIRDAAVGAVFDITAVDNLVEAAHREAYGREIARVLKPGGLAVMDAVGAVVCDPHTGIRNRLFHAVDLDSLFVPALDLVAGNRFDFIDEAAQERWTRRFHLRVYRKADAGGQQASPRGG